STHLAVKPVPRRARFIAEIKLLVAAGPALDHPLKHPPRAIDLAPISSFTIPAPIGPSQPALFLSRVNPDKRFGILLHGPPSAHEARLGPPEQPSYSYCTSGRAADHGPGHNV